jgi:hypothetical protein
MEEAAGDRFAEFTLGLAMTAAGDRFAALAMT